ncbi:MAG: TolB family protein [Candidatus Binatia bacterium]
MLNRRLYYLGLAIFFIFSGCTSSEGTSEDRFSFEDSKTPAQAPPKQDQTVVPDKVLMFKGEMSVTLPEKGILVALRRWGSTTLAVFDIPRKLLVPIVTKTTGELVVSQNAERVAYLVRNGVNPAKNHIEILNLRQGKGQRIKPANNYAILGFTLAPHGTQLAYAGLNLRRSSSRRVHWRSGLADLEKFETRITATSENDGFPGDGIPVPFAWSGTTGEIYLRGLSPFRGMVHQGIWARKFAGSAVRRVLPEPSYTGVPRLSPDGRYLAYLTTRVEDFPPSYLPSPGAPPGNVLVVMNLLTGARRTWLQETGSAVGAFSWTVTGREILVSRQEWVEGRFRDVALLRVGREKTSHLWKFPSSPSSRVSGVEACSQGHFFWVEKDDRGAKLRADGFHPELETLFELSQGEIRVIGCLEN